MTCLRRRDTPSAALTTISSPCCAHVLTSSTCLVRLRCRVALSVTPHSA